MLHECGPFYVYYKPMDVHTSESDALMLVPC